MPGLHVVVALCFDVRFPLCCEAFSIYPAFFWRTPVERGTSQGTDHRQTEESVCTRTLSTTSDSCEKFPIFQGESVKINQERQDGG